MTLVIGLTGGIATGKSTVSSMFKKFQIPVIDADKIAREVVEPGRESYLKIIHSFGTNILNDDQTINRKKLGEIIFSDRDKRKLLNSIVHPAVRKEMLKQRDAYVQAGRRGVVLDIPLLFESNLTTFVQKTIVVYVSEEIQLQRLMKRDSLSVDEAYKRINAQMPISDKMKLADVVIDNSYTKDETFKQLKNILQNWKIL